MILSVNRLDDFHFSFFGHSNAIVVYLSIMLLSLLECIRLQHVHSRLWLYWAQSDRFSNFNFYVKKGKKYTTQNKGQGSSQVPVTCNRGVRAVAYSRLAEAASTSNWKKETSLLKTGCRSEEKMFSTWNYSVVYTKLNVHQSKINMQEMRIKLLW